MFIRFVCGDTDASSRVEAGIFCAAYKLRRGCALPEYEADRLADLLWWFDTHLESPFKYRLRQGWRGRRAVCWFKSSAREHLAMAHEMAALLHDNGVYIRTIRSEKAGYMLYEDEVQVLAQPFADMRI